MLKCFLDSSVIISGLISDQGASAKVLSLCETNFLQGYVSKKVVEEIRSVIKRKFNPLKECFEPLIYKSKLKIARDIDIKFLSKAKNWIKDKNDVHILAAAKQLDVDVLLTLDLRHFIKDPEVSRKSGLKIMTPGEFVKGFIKIY